MLLLVSTSDKVQVITGAAVTVDVHASFMDYNGTTTTPGRQNTAITTAATTDVVAAPGSGQRNVKFLSARNKHASSSVVVTVQHTDGTTVSQLTSLTLLAGEQLIFAEAAGFYVVDSAGNMKTTQTGAGRLIRPPQVLTAGSSYTAPAGCALIFVECIGGGGGGGGATFATPNMGFGGGGASGAHCAKTFAVVAGTAYTYAIGGAGAAGANTGGTGGTGGSTTFAVGGTTITALGGLGGVGQTGAATLAVVLGGAGQLGTNGDINDGGDPGKNGVRLSGVLGGSGQGGSSIYGGGGAGRITNGAGIAGLGYGAGGGGAAAVSANQLGAAGTAGVIMITEYA
jgi:hypothetical protein